MFCALSKYDHLNFCIFVLQYVIRNKPIIALLMSAATLISGFIGLFTHSVIGGGGSCVNHQLAFIEAIWF